jgi:hypothetical protein
LNFAFNKQDMPGLKFRRCLRRWFCIIASIELTACVTINIYFPAAAAEKAADKVIDEIWQTPAGQSPSPEPKATPAVTAPASSASPQESAP